MSRTLFKILLACSSADNPVAVAIPATSAAGHLRTTQPVQAARMPDVQGEVQPLLTAGDTIPNGSVWAPIPDGLGGDLSVNDLIMYSNHGLSSTG